MLKKYINNFLVKVINLNQYKKQKNILIKLKNILIWKIKLQKVILNFLNYIDIMFFRKIEKN
jgi:hypothetical protein